MEETKKSCSADGNPSHLWKLLEDPSRCRISFKVLAGAAYSGILYNTAGLD